MRLELVHSGSTSIAIEKPGQRTQLGGHPTWIQADESPCCPACGREMSFVAQIDSLGGAYMFGDCGMLYVFYCVECHEADAFEQCY